MDIDVWEFQEGEVDNKRGAGKIAERIETIDNFPIGKKKRVQVRRVVIARWQ